jgi:hypothetical protein
LDHRRQGLDDSDGERDQERQRFRISNSALNVLVIHVSEDGK